MTAPVEGSRGDGRWTRARVLISLFALGWLVPFYVAARPPELSAARRAALARPFSFREVELRAPSERSARCVRSVHPDLDHLRAWVSVVGAAVALDDLDGDGLSNDICWVDPRTDEVFVAPVPGTGARFASFVLEPDPATHDRRTTAPTGILPCDLDEDGRTDVLATYWGRPPVAFVRYGAARATDLTASAFYAIDLAPSTERWYTNAATMADVDGDGHADLIVGNYFPDGARVLDERGSGNEIMHASMSRATNGGHNRILLWRGARSGEEPSVTLAEAPNALPEPGDRGWTLAVGAADLDGDLLPELYFANDFGPDQLLHNRSTPGRIELVPLYGRRALARPRSKTMGRDSFKGMGVDFGDVDGDGRLDIYVSNITTQFGLFESQFLWSARGPVELMAIGRAPFVDDSERLGLARSGWAWDAKLADLDNDGRPEALQALGFMKGSTERWPELHEIAMGNDQLLSDPAVWHRFEPGDGLSGDDPIAFFVAGTDGRYWNVSREVGLGTPRNTRGIALADVDGDGDLDLALANQWEASTIAFNEGASGGSVGLHLLLAESAGPTVVRAGHPDPTLSLPCAVTASVRVLVGERARVAQVDGGNGHSGSRSRDVLIGIGDAASATVEIRWRDRQGRPHATKLELPRGWSTVLLGGEGDVP